MSIFKRNLFLHVNKFQWRILFYLMALGFSCLVLILLFLSYIYADFNNFLHSGEFFTIKICILIALPLTACLLLITCLYLYHVTNKMFGPYERVVREVAETVKSGQKKEILLRKGDKMFQELIECINTLIRRAY